MMFVAIEITAALRQAKRVIPVLVGGAVMLRAKALPETMRTLARRNVVSLRPERFKADCQGLVAALKEYLATTARENERAQPAVGLPKRETAKAAKGASNNFVSIAMTPSLRESPARADGFARERSHRTVLMETCYWHSPRTLMPPTCCAPATLISTSLAPMSQHISGSCRFRGRRRAPIPTPTATQSCCVWSRRRAKPPSNRGAAPSTGPLRSPPLLATARAGRRSCLRPTA